MFAAAGGAASRTSVATKVVHVTEQRRHTQGKRLSDTPGDGHRASVHKPESDTLGDGHRASVRATGGRASRQQRSSKAWTAGDVVKIFERFDKDHSGTINKEEFRTFLKESTTDYDDIAVFIDKWLLTADGDGSGEIEYREFVNFMLQEENASLGGFKKTELAASDYQPLPGEKIYVPSWNVKSLLLIRNSETFSFISDSRYHFSEGVQGVCVKKGKVTLLEARHFGCQAGRAGGRASHPVVLDTEELTGRLHGMFECHVSESLSDMGWLNPGDRRASSHRLTQQGETSTSPVRHGSSEQETEESSAAKLIIPQGDTTPWEADTIVRLFERCDEDGSGTLESSEFGVLLQSLLPSFSTHKIDTMLAAADKDGNGHIDYEEFTEWLFKDVGRLGFKKKQEVRSSHYITKEGETLYIPSWNFTARLLMRTDGSFSFVSDYKNRFSDGVQGTVTEVSVGPAGTRARLEAKYFGSRSKPLGDTSYAVVLSKAEVPRTPGCYSVSLVGAEVMSWLNPVLEEQLL